MKVKADTLFYGGKIYTMEAPGVCKEAVVLKDGEGRGTGAICL